MQRQMQFDWFAVCGMHVGKKGGAKMEKINIMEG